MYLYDCTASVPTLPDSTAPNAVGPITVSVTQPTAPNNTQLTASWAAVSDLPSGSLASGIKQYNLEVQKKTGTSTFTTVQTATTTSTSKTFTGLPDNCILKVSVTPYDNKNNYASTTNSSEYSINDRTPPTQPTSVSINPSGWTNQNPTITWAGITDHDWTGQQNTLHYIQYKVDGGTPVNLDIQVPPPSSGSASIDLSGLSDGQHTIAIYGVDNAGNIGLSRTVTYKRDTTAPEVSINDPVEHSGLSGPVSIVGSITDPHISGWNIEYGEGEDPQQWILLGNGTTAVSNGELCVWDLTSIQSTDVKLRLTAWDQAGNQKQQIYSYVRSEDGILTTPADLEVTSPASLVGPVIIDSTNPAFTYQRIDEGSIDGWTGTLYVDDVAKENMTFNLLDFAEGSLHRFYIQSEDTQGSSHFSTMTYTEIAFSDPLDNSDNIAEITGAVRNADGTITLAEGATTGMVISDGNTFAYPLKRVKVTAQTNTPEGTSITFYASTDNGQTWIPCEQGTFVNVQGLGKTLQVKAANCARPPTSMTSRLRGTSCALS